jgi:hypothetical protein
MSDDIADLREQVAQLRETRATHAEKIEAVATRVNEMSNDIKTILGYLERSKGSWKTLLVLGGAAGTLVEAMHQVGPLLRKLFS